jgi:general secretion pathway protein E/type IV pilus assembly protein PilB
LYEFLDFDYDVFYALDSRLKILSGLDVSEKRKPQDGAFSMKFGSNSFDFRVSTLPTIWGESIVIRILDKRNILKKIDEIGITEKNLEILKKALSSPNGIFLVTGPTGSGKSTTLYASLNEINNVSEKIITVEDPVEYKLKGIQQVQVNAKVGLTFAGALRSILRQDPDIIMIGEIRDLETLEIAIKAALTGHLVISTLHTNDAVSAINRMIDMGADPFMVATSLVGVEAQRLVKTICPYCKTTYKPADMYLEPIKNILPKNTVFYKGKGCEKCNMTGFSGRTLISEIFLNDEHLEALISKNKDKLELLHYLQKQGYKTMFYDGLLKALKGLTTLEEVYRVAKL